MRGGLGQVNVLSCLFFGGVSGSAIADVSAIGGSMIPKMVERGYDRDYAVNVTISAALVALLVPPSHNLILFSAAAGGGISIADLFAAGIVAGVAADAERDAHGIPDRAPARLRRQPRFPALRAVAVSFVAALPGLLLVFVIFGGIRAGIFTAVESAAVAVLYAVAVTAARLSAPRVARVSCGVLERRAYGRHHPVRDQRRGGVRLVARLPAGAGAGRARFGPIADDPLAVLLLMNSCCSCSARSWTWRR